MKKAFKFLFVTALIALMAVSAVACAGNSTGDATPTPTPDGQTSGTDTIYVKPGETYSFYSWQYTSDQPYTGDDERSQAMRERVENIEKTYQVTIQFVPNGNTTSMLQSAFQGVPDIRCRGTGI